jgi:ribose transport system permease protein
MVQRTGNLDRGRAIDTTAIRVREADIVRQARYRGASQTIGLLIALVALLIIFSFLSERFLSVANAQNILTQAAIPLVIAVGATLVILLGSIDLSVEGVMGAAGVTWILLTANTRNPEQDLGVWAWVIALSVALVLGLGNGLISTALKVPSFIVTLGMWYIGLGFATVLYGRDIYPRVENPALKGWTSQLTLGIPNSFWVAILVVILGVFVVRYTRIGRVALAVGNSESIARSAGLPAFRVKIVVFAIAGVLSGLGGILTTIQLGMGIPSVGQGFLFVVIPAVVIGGTNLAGGKGGIMRTVLGVFLLTVLNNGLILSGVDTSWQSAVSGAILVAAVVLAAWSQRGRLGVAK